jgi:COPI associated protein
LRQSDKSIAHKQDKAGRLISTHGMASSWQKYEDNPFDSSEHALVGGKTTMDASSRMTAVDPTPPWLQSEAASTTTAAANHPPLTSQRPVGSVTNNGSSQQQQIDPAVPRMILYTRVMNLVLSVCMILASLLSLLTTDNATTGVLACYVVVFSCLLCCFETHLKQISKFIALNFGFMYSAKSRSAFMIFVGTILFSFSLFGKVIGCLMLGNAGFNIFVLVKYPEYDDLQRKDAQSEIKDYLAANPAFAQQFMAIGMKTGTEILSNNPGKSGRIN